MVKHTRKRYRGGASPKLAGQGTYGCGFMPPLSCSYNTAERTNTFSKLMHNNVNSGNNSTVIKEIDVIYKLRTIDPTFKYSLYPALDEDTSGTPNTIQVKAKTFKKCRPRQNNIAKYSAELSKCKLIDFPINPNNYIILQSPYGGVSLSTYVAKLKMEFNIDKLINLLLSIENLFEGLLEFHKNTFYHMDIKLPNIVVNETSKGLETRFIDFGISVDLENSNDKVHTTMYEQNYFAWPFELAFYNKDINRIPKYKIAPILNKFYTESLEYNIQNHIISYNNYVDNKTGRFIHNADSVYPILDSIKFEPQSYFFQKTDIYSMGIIINAIIFNITGVLLHYKLDKDGNKVDTPAILVTGTTAIVELDSPSANNNPNIELIRAFIKNGGMDILLFANKLVSFNPTDRYSTIESYTKYNELCDNLRKNKVTIIGKTPLPKNNQSIVSKVVNTVSSFFAKPSPPPPPMPPTAWLQTKNHTAINIKSKKLNHIAIPMQPVQARGPARLPVKRYSKP